MRLLVDLAENDLQHPTALSQVASRQNISEKYLQQVALLLTRAGILTSVKGSGGGYLLTNEPTKIQVYDVLDILEGGVSFSEPPKDEDTAIRRCLNTHFYQPMDTHLMEVFKGMSLADVVSSGSFSYSI
jgi:Rrf2 family protein